MLPVSFDQASYRHPELVRQALACFAGLPAGEIAWFLVECHDDPDQPLDEAACADVMERGRHGDPDAHRRRRGVRLPLRARLRVGTPLAPSSFRRHGGRRYRETREALLRAERPPGQGQTKPVKPCFARLLMRFGPGGGGPHLHQQRHVQLGRPFHHPFDHSGGGLGL